MSKESKTKGMGAVDLTLFSVCAVLVIDTLTASARIGPSSITWWCLTLVFFVVPYGMIASELGTTWPGEGGIYDWIKRAFGYRWAVRTTWFYWINVALWMPAVYILFAGMFSQLFFPELNLWAQIAIGVVLTWITVGICDISVDQGKLVPNLGALAKVVIIVALGGGGFYLAATKGVANEITPATMIPSLDSGLAFLPAIIFNLLGFELVSCMGGAIRDPRRDVPKSIFTAAVTVTLLYILGTIGLLLALPVDKIGLVSGIVEAFRMLFGEESAVVVVLGIFALFTFVTNMVTWCMGANRAAAEAAAEGELPALFGKLDPKTGAPRGANLVTGMVSTTVIVLYGIIAGSNDELFWTLFAFSSCIFLLPYLFMFPAFLRLRRIAPAEHRPFRVPGGAVLALIAAVIPTIFVIQAVILFIFPKAATGEIEWSYSLPVLIGIVLTLAAGEVMVRRAVKNKNHAAAEAEPRVRAA